MFSEIMDFSEGVKSLLAKASLGIKTVLSRNFHIPRLQYSLRQLIKLIDFTEMETKEGKGVDSKIRKFDGILVYDH